MAERPDLLAFALAAVLSPTYVVSAIAQGRLPTLLMNMLQGAALLNDASGQVTFKFALAAAFTGVFSLTDASLRFVLVALDGLAVGVALSWLLGRLRMWMGDAPPHAVGFGTRRAGDGRCTLTAERRSAAALGSRQPILRVRLPGLAPATSNRAQSFTSGELLGQRRDGELLPFAEG